MLLLACRAAVARTGSPCGAGWYNFDDETGDEGVSSCVRIVTTPKPFPDAASSCDGGKLLSIKSSKSAREEGTTGNELVQFVRELALAQGVSTTTPLWIGAAYSLDAGAWGWNDLTAPNSLASSSQLWSAPPPYVPFT